MKILVAVTKSNVYALCVEIQNALKKDGHKVDLVRQQKKLRPDYDLVFQVAMPCDRSKANNRKFRKTIQAYHQSRGIPVVIIDGPFFRGGKFEKQVYTFGLNGIKNNGGALERAVPNYEKLKKFEIKFKPWSNGPGVMILGQNTRGFLFSNFIKTAGETYLGYYNQWIKEIRRYHDGDIFFRPHKGDPKLGKKLKDKSVKIVSVDKSYLGKQLRAVNVSLTHSSNASIDSLIHGVPCITTSDINVCWPVSSNDISKIQDSRELRFERLPFFAKLADQQYHLSEIKNGEWWRKLRDHV